MFADSSDLGWSSLAALAAMLAKDVERRGDS